MRIVLALLTLLATGAAQAAELEWQPWSEALFARARAENRFVLLSVQSWWCPWCRAMNEDTYTDPEVQAEIARHFIPTRVDQDNRPDIANRYERWGWPATVLFGPDGTEIVKLRGFYSPPHFLPVLQETVRDPSPVDYGQFGGPERPTQRASRLEPAAREEILGFMEKAWDEVNAGWGESKLVDGPTLLYALDRARDGDQVLAGRVRRTLHQMLKLIDAETGAISQVALKPDWSKAPREYPMFAQEGALKAYSLAWRMWGEPAFKQAADRIYGFLAHTLTGENGAFYTSLGLERGRPGVDRSQYARENGMAITALLAYYDATGDADALRRARAAAEWALQACRQPDGQFTHASFRQSDSLSSDGPFLGDTLWIAQAFLALYRSTAERPWLAAARAAANALLENFADAATGGFWTVKPGGGATPPAVKQKDENVAAARFLNRLADYTGEARYRAAAEAALGYLGSPAVLDAYGFLPDILLAEAEMTREPLHLTVVGPKNDPRARILFAAALAYPAPHLRVEWWDQREGPLPHHDLQYPPYPEPAAFACTSRFCSLPVTAAADVSAAIDQLEAVPR
jgi:uncharacterized protein